MHTPFLSPTLSPNTVSLMPGAVEVRVGSEAKSNTWQMLEQRLWKDDGTECGMVLRKMKKFKTVISWYARK